MDRLTADDLGSLAASSLCERLNGVALAGLNQGYVPEAGDGLAVGREVVAATLAGAGV